MSRRHGTPSRHTSLGHRELPASPQVWDGLHTTHGRRFPSRGSGTVSSHARNSTQRLGYLCSRPCLLDVPQFPPRACLLHTKEQKKLYEYVKITPVFRSASWCLLVPGMCQTPGGSRGGLAAQGADAGNLSHRMQTPKNRLLGSASGGRPRLRVPRLLAAGTALVPPGDSPVWGGPGA